MKNKKWKYDWNAIQVFYDKGNSWRDIMNEFGVSNRAIQKAVNDGRLITRSRSEAMILAFKKHGPNISSEQARKATSLRQSLNNSGGKCKWYNINGVKVQGTWERDMALYFDEIGVKWEKPKKPFLYVLKGKLKRYTPDFYLNDFNVYLEVKGYWWGNDREKMEAVIVQNSQEKFIIIEKNEFEKILDGKHTW